MNVGIIDYGCGNIFSLYHSLIKINTKTKIIKNFKDIKNFEIVFLPGVGAFKSAMDVITDNEIDIELYKHIKKGGKLIGICLGMQLLCDMSNEFGEHKGLSLIPGQVIKFDNSSGKTIIPQIGWNRAKFTNNEIFSDDDFYFLHSYKVLCDKEYTLAYSEYGGQRFSSVIRLNNIYGFQFHPEKSGKQGSNILKKIVSSN